jgi:ATP-dependent RNA helicase SUPV3L1/SUV3
LGCSKENFIRLVKKMNYKSIEKENKIYLKYLPFKNKEYKNVAKKTNESSPFNVLKELGIK